MIKVEAEWSEVGDTGSLGYVLLVGLNVSSTPDKTGDWFVTDIYSDSPRDLSEEEVEYIASYLLYKGFAQAGEALEITVNFPVHTAVQEGLLEGSGYGNCN